MIDSCQACGSCDSVIEVMGDNKGLFNSFSFCKECGVEYSTAEQINRNALIKRLNSKEERRDNSYE